MIRRNKIALTASICLVLGTGSVSALTLVASTNSAAAGTETAAGVNGLGGSPVTVYEDKYIDDLLYVPPADAGAGTAAATGVGAPVEATASDGRVSASDGWVAGGSLETSVGVEGATGQPSPESGRSTNPTVAENPNPPQSSPAIAPANPSPTPGIVSSPEPVPTTSPPRSTIPTGAELPSDWPAGVPYPPIPSGCRQPHLEDNGVWNCEH
ncbi:MAG: hypothetical protein WCJ04_02095 [Actinomycetes bacterium]